MVRRVYASPAHHVSFLFTLFVLSVGRLEIKSVEAKASQVRHEILLFRFLIVLWYNGRK